MTDASRTEIIARLRGWLANERPAAAAIGDDTDIIETRVLSSLQLVEFMIFIEELSGRPVLVEGLDANRLRTLSRIHTEFFEGPRV